MQNPDAKWFQDTPICPEETLIDTAVQGSRQCARLNYVRIFWILVWDNGYCPEYAERWSLRVEFLWCHNTSTSLLRHTFSVCWWWRIYPSCSRMPHFDAQITDFVSSTSAQLGAGLSVVLSCSRSRQTSGRNMGRFRILMKPTSSEVQPTRAADLPFLCSDLYQQLKIEHTCQCHQVRYHVRLVLFNFSKFLRVKPWSVHSWPFA